MVQLRHTRSFANCFPDLGFFFFKCLTKDPKVIDIFLLLLPIFLLLTEIKEKQKQRRGNYIHIKSCSSHDQVSHERFFFSHNLQSHFDLSQKGPV